MDPDYERDSEHHAFIPANVIRTYYQSSAYCSDTHYASLPMLMTESKRRALIAEIHQYDSGNVILALNSFLIFFLF